ncbi:MAG: hypothetical protein M1816_007658 [Peltula sp. TS41687]|nr:MAG: hypothetical protein M1816_007658 [Peltula sp. TS41687]
MPRASESNWGGVQVDEFWLSGPNFDPFDALGITPDEQDFTVQENRGSPIPTRVGTSRGRPTVGYVSTFYPQLRQLANRLETRHVPGSAGTY